MTLDVESRLLVMSPDEIRELADRGANEQGLDTLLGQAAQLCVDAQAALAHSIAAEQPKLLTSVVLARHRRRWRWHLMLWGIFVPLGVLSLIFFGTAIARLVTVLLWP